MPTIDQLISGDLRRESNRGTISTKLQDISAASFDLVAPSSALSFNEEDISSATITSSEPILLPTGVASVIDGVRVTRRAQQQSAQRARMPWQYVERLTTDGHTDLAAQHLNELAVRSKKPAMFRCLIAEDGIAVRSVLSNGYQAIDNIDLLNSVVAGLLEANIGLDDCEIDADWRSDRFRLRITVPQIEQLAPELLADYRPPFSMSPARGVHDRFGDDEKTPPALWAGLEIGNSETGNGSTFIVPRAVVPVCRNGLTRSMDMVRKVHMGSKLEDGVIDWSDSTRRKAIELVTSQVADAARSFCSVSYLRRIVEQMSSAKQHEATASTSVQVVQNACSLTDAEASSVLDAFASSGDQSVFGLAQAVTVAAQHADDGDRQSELEDAFWKIIDKPSMFASAV